MSQNKVKESVKTLIPFLMDFSFSLDKSKPRYEIFLVLVFKNKKIVLKFATSFSSHHFLYKFLILEQKQVCGL